MIIWSEYRVSISPGQPKRLVQPLSKLTIATQLYVSVFINYNLFIYACLCKMTCIRDMACVNHQLQPLDSSRLFDVFNVS